MHERGRGHAGGDPPTFAVDLLPGGPPLALEEVERDRHRLHVGDRRHRRHLGAGKRPE
jgi:hypothetical protein